MVKQSAFETKAGLQNKRKKTENMKWKYEKEDERAWRKLNKTARCQTKREIKKFAKKTESVKWKYEKKNI